MPHIHEKIDFTTEVFVVHKGKVLLRMHDKFNLWLSVGGHIELEHDPVETAIKEVKEEVGLDIELVDTDRLGTRDFGDWTTPLIPPRFMNRHRISDTHEHVSFVYFATTKNTEIAIPRDSHEWIPDDHWGWFTADEVDELSDCPEHIKYYAKVALEEVKE